MKKALCMFLVFIMLGMSVQAAVKDIEFIDVYTVGETEYYKKDGVLYIQGKGDMPDFSINYYDKGGIVSPFTRYRSTKKVVIKEGITSIGRAAFYNADFEEVVIPKSVTVIDEYAFYGMKKLKKISFEQGLNRIENYAFLGCVELEEINLPESLTHIGSAAFHGCYNIKAIKIPDSVEYVYSNAFEYCIGAKSIYIGKGMQGYMLDLRELNSLETITVSEENKFYKVIDNVLFSKDKTKLIKYPPKRGDAEYTVPDFVTGVERYAFKGCENLSAVTLPDSIDPRGLYAPETLRFESTALYDSYSIMTYRGDTIYYTMGENDDGKWFCVHKVADDNSDKTFALPKLLSGCETAGIDKCVYTTDGIECVDASELDTLPKQLFRQTAVKSVILSKNLKVIDQLMFYECKNLEKIVLPEGLERIERCGFTDCSNLKEITIPSSVNYIGEKAFEYCKSLERIVIREGNLKKLGNEEDYLLQCFNNISENAEVFLPASLDAVNENEFRNFEYVTYGMIGWREFPKNIIVHAPKGSVGEEWAIKNELAVKDEKSDKYHEIIKRYEEGPILKSIETWDTCYGTLVHYGSGGVMHATGSLLNLVRWDGTELFIVNNNAPKINQWSNAPWTSLEITEDKKSVIVKYNGTKSNYVIKANLETGEVVTYTEAI